MKYSNPLPPEGINTTAEHPLKEFALLTGALIALVVAFVAVVGLFTEKFAPYIPFKTEVSIANTLAHSIPDGDDEVETWLQHLADKLAAAQGMPEGISVTVHYVDNGTVNAMASLGGHIIMFRGLMEKLGSENAIAMVLGHEIAHIRYRHPIQKLGRSAVISLALTAIGFSANDAGGILGDTGLLTELSFSRSQEQQADDAALQSLDHCYGHVNGATELFETLMKEEPETLLRTPLFSSHPLTEKRVDHLKAFARAHGWPLKGKLVPLPRSIRERFAADRKAGHQTHNETSS